MIPPIVPVARDQKIPLSFAQRRLWFLHKLDPGLTAYNMPAAYRDPWAVECRRVRTRRSNEMIERHESLRTAFVEIDGEPVQQILAAAQLSLTADRLQRTTAAVEPEAKRAIDARTKRGSRTSSASAAHARQPAPAR